MLSRLVLGAPPPVSPLIHMPKMVATRMATKSCQVLQDRRSLILNSPGLGGSSDDAKGASTLSGGDVTAIGQVVIPFDPAVMLAERDDWASISCLAKATRKARLLMSARSDSFAGFNEPPML